MDTTERIRDTFLECAELATRCAESLPASIVQAAAVIAGAIVEGHRVLVCGNGGSAAEALHFSSEMLNRFEMERPPLPALALTADAATLTCIANDYDFTEVFAKQVRALGQGGDVLLALTTSGASANIVAAIDAAHDREMTVVLLSGRDGGACALRLAGSDTEVRVPARSTARIQEVHLMIIHQICDLVDRHLMGVEG